MEESRHTPAAPEAPGRDDLFAPTLQDSAPADPQQRPWRLRSQFWVAFLGGTLAYALVAYRNGQRLGMPPAHQRLVLLLGAVGLLATVAVTYGINRALDVGRAGTVVRLGSRIVAVAVYLMVYQLQKGPDRRYSFGRGDDAYASLWALGLAAVFGLGVLQNLLVYSILRFGNLGL